MANEHFLDHSDGCDGMTILLDQKEVLLEVDSVVLMGLHLTQSSWPCLVMNYLISLCCIQWKLVVEMATRSVLMQPKPQCHLTLKLVENR